MTASLDELLDAHHLNLNDILDTVRDEIGRLAYPSAAALTDADREQLEGSGLEFSDAAKAAGLRAKNRIVAEQAGMLAGPTAVEVAAAAGVAPSRIRHWVANNEVVTVKVGREHRFPGFQFGVNGRPLPGLKRLIEALPDGWSVMELKGFLATPQPDLEINGAELTPAEWMAGGNSVEAVVDLLGDDW